MASLLTKWIHVMCISFCLLGFLVIQVKCCTYRQIGLQWNIFQTNFISSQESEVQNRPVIGRAFSALENSSISGLVSIQSSEPLHVVDSRFLSVALGSGWIREGWRRFDFNSVKLKNLARALSPAILRIGGTDADYLIFNSTKVSLDKVNDTEQGFVEDTRYNEHEVRDNFTMTASDWDNINKWAADVGWDMLFDLNMLLRNGTSWDPTNARELLKYNSEKGYRIAGWELGNEPNHIHHHSNFTMPADQLGKDFVTLRKLLDKYGYQDSLLLGPDITQPYLNNQLDEEEDRIGSPQHAQDYLKRFLQHCGNSTYATTWHHYYTNSTAATADNFTDPALMNVLKKKIKIVQEAVQKYRPFLPKTWLGETAGVVGGGAPGLSETYIGGFLWLDKLGVSAMEGMDLVLRQQFFHGSYGLIYMIDMYPTPGYWLSYLYKQLVGPIVLNTSVSIADVTSWNMIRRTPTHIRAYAHCTNNKTRIGTSYTNGSVTLFVINLHKTQDIKLTLTGDMQNKSVDQYLLTPHDNDITSMKVNLNGKIVELTWSDTIPTLHGEPLAQNEPISMPPLTYGFYVINANATACQ